MLDPLYNLLAKIGFSDPIHSPITHMPIGLIIGAFLFLLIALIFKKKRLILTARHAAVLGFIFVFPTILFGVFDWLHFYNGVLMKPIKIKMILAGFTLIVLAVGLIFGKRVRFTNAFMMIIYSLAFIAVVGLGYMGAGIVYGRGVEPQSSTVSGNGQSSADLNSGRKIFFSNCQACHANGGNVIYPELPLVTSKHLQDENSFISFIRSPKLPDGSEGSMPPFSENDISSKDAGDLYAFITSRISSGHWQ